MTIQESAAKLVGLYGTRRWFHTVYPSSECIYFFVKSLKILPAYIKNLKQTEEGYRVMVSKVAYADTCGKV